MNKLHLPVASNPRTSGVLPPLAEPAVEAVTRTANSWNRSFVGVTAGAAAGALLSVVVAGEVNPSFACFMGACGASGFAMGDAAAVHRTSWLRKVIIYYAAASLLPLMLFPILVTLYGVLPGSLPRAGAVAAALLFVAGMIPLHHWLPRHLAWSDEPHIQSARSAQRLVVAGSLLTLFALGWLRITASSVQLELLFLAPVVGASWTTGRWGGLAAALVAAAVYSITGAIAEPEGTHNWVSAFNNLILLGALVPTALVVAALRRLLSAEQERANVDSLTGLWNRRAFQDAFENELARCRRGAGPCTLAYIDLDGFKAINDALGHATGDDVLRAVAGVLRTRVRQTDVAARLGGDEFALLLVHTPAAAAEPALRAIQRALLDQMRLGGWAVTFSIGAVADITEGSTDDLLGHADALMYAVKREGKNEIRICRADRAATPMHRQH
jgi:diguanylate cyclase (GGDEF)-like protein